MASRARLAMVGKQGKSERRSGGERGQGAEASGCVERPAKAEEVVSAVALLAGLVLNLRISLES